ncbi:MAG TPA: tyrosine-type recombinase/integrase [Nitrospirota bacterium]|nr:tyrosine-type recombinase/integrase [Nitrospirota bacterium]
MTTNLRLIYRESSPAGISPYRIVDHQDHEIRWANAFLDAQHLRSLSSRSVRSYGYDLLNFARWWCQRKSTQLSRLNESHLLDYVRHQLESLPKPTPQTINHRLTVVRCLYQFHFGRELPRGHGSVRSIYTTRSPFGYGRPGHRVGGLRLRQPRRAIVPLSSEEVSQFWSSFRTYRDLGITALMLFNGLRSCEVIGLHLEELRLSERQFRVRGKGNKERILPLSHDTMQILQCYLETERPCVDSPFVFLCLKGRKRGHPITSAGLRSLFRHHRRLTKVTLANPHRFRHTFGSSMVRSGVSLPALMHLMGHSHIHTTMLYVSLSPQDVWREYQKAIRNMHKVPLSLTQ